jgi:hypothetical protein
VDDKTGAIMDVQGIINFSHQRTATFSNSMREAKRQWSEIVTSDLVVRINDFVTPFDEQKNCFTVSGKQGSDSTVIQIESCKQTVETINTFAQDCQNPKGAKARQWGEQTLKTMIILDSIYESAKSRGETIFLRGDQGKDLLMVGQ